MDTLQGPYEDATSAYTMLSRACYFRPMVTVCVCVCLHTRVRVCVFFFTYVIFIEAEFSSTNIFKSTW